MMQSFVMLAFLIVNTLLHYYYIILKASTSDKMGQWAYNNTVELSQWMKKHAKTSTLSMLYLYMTIAQRGEPLNFVGHARQKSFIDYIGNRYVIQINHGCYWGSFHLQVIFFKALGNDLKYISNG